MVVVFLLVAVTVVGLIHLYLWKRLVRDPLRPGRARRIGGVITVVLAVLVPATLIGSRSGIAGWLGWPGYLWLAVMFYLLVTLLVLEVPRLLIGLWLRRRPTTPAAGATATPLTADPATTTGPGPDPGNAATADPDSAHATTTDATAADATGAETGGRTAIGVDPTGPSTTGGPGPVDTAPGAAVRTPAAEPVGPAPRGVDRRLLLARGAAIMAGLTAVGLTGYGARTALGPPQLDRAQLPLPKLPRSMDGTRLAVVSDIHIGPLTGPDHLRRIVDLINSTDPDVVCVVGDMVDGSVAELGRYARPLADLRARRGSYFVTGNHEYFSGFQEWVDEVAELGVRPLRNERLALDGMDLAGVNDVTGDEYGDAPDYERALGDRDRNRPVVLMAHQPVAAREAVRYGVDLQVSGHTHGGQMVPFNLLVGLAQPVVSGLGEVDGMPVYVTNGAGFWGPPVRVGAPPQVTLLELRTP